MQQDTVEIIENLSDVDLIKSYGKIVTFPSGETLLQQGRNSDGIYLILEGTLRNEIFFFENSRVEIDICEPGHFIGEMCLADQTACGYSSIAISQVTCAFISMTVFEIISMYLPQLKLSILQSISRQVCLRMQILSDAIAEYLVWPEAKISFLSGIIDLFATSEPISEETPQMKREDLMTFPLFRFFQAEELDQILKHSLFINVNRNCTLVHEKERRPECYLVIHGGIQSRLVMEKKVAKLSVIGPGKVFVSPACIDRKNELLVSFVSCEQAVLLKLGEAELDLIQHSLPETWQKLFDLIARSIIRLEKSINRLYMRLRYENYNQ